MEHTDRYTFFPVINLWAFLSWHARNFLSFHNLLQKPPTKNPCNTSGFSLLRSCFNTSESSKNYSFCLRLYLADNEVSLKLYCTAATVMRLPPFLSRPPSLTHPNILNVGIRYVPERNNNENVWNQGKNKNQNRIELHENELYNMLSALNIILTI